MLLITFSEQTVATAVYQMAFTYGYECVQAASALSKTWLESPKR